MTDDDERPDGSNWKTLLSLSPQDTADWIRGKRKIRGEDFTDPALGVKFEQEKAEIKIGLGLAIERGLDPEKDDDLREIASLLVDSLPNSPISRRELARLRDRGTYDELRAKITELTEFAIDD